MDHTWIWPNIVHAKVFSLNTKPYTGSLLVWSKLVQKTPIPTQHMLLSKIAGIPYVGVLSYQAMYHISTLSGQYCITDTEQYGPVQKNLVHTIWHKLICTGTQILTISSLQKTLFIFQNLQEKLLFYSAALS